MVEQEFLYHYFIMFIRSIRITGVFKEKDKKNPQI